MTHAGVHLHVQWRTLHPDTLAVSVTRDMWRVGSQGQSAYLWRGTVPLEPTAGTPIERALAMLEHALSAIREIEARP